MRTLWQQIKIRYKAFEKQRIETIMLSSDIRRNSKKVIHSVLHNKKRTCAKSIIPIKKQVDNLLRQVAKNPYLYAVGAINDGLEEYVELVFLEMYLCNNHKALHYISPKMHHEPIIGGIADASGELVRLVRASLNVVEAEAVHKYVSDLYHKFLDLEVSRNNKLRNKMEEVRRNLLHLEEIIFNLKLKE